MPRDDDDPPIFRQLADEQLLEFDPPTSQLPLVPLAGESPPDIPADMPAPPDDHDAGKAGYLGTVTDEEWREAHERLRRDMPELEPELDYIWNPAIDGRALIEPNERDMAPGEGRYDPNTDERFHGGGFRG